MQTWSDIAKRALIGTARQGNSVTPSAGDDPQNPIHGILLKIPTKDREWELLQYAAIYTLCRRAGKTLELTTDEPPAPAEPDMVPSIGPLTRENLSQMLQGENEEALPEWLAAVAEHGRRVGEDLLPSLLALGERRPELRTAITRVIDVRGRWLATHNPAWSYATQTPLYLNDDKTDNQIAHQTAHLFLNRGDGDKVTEGEIERIWQTGERGERIALLKWLRGSNPKNANALVTSTWTQDPPEERAMFLSTFIVGISLEDESLLERALDDKRKEVRQQAQALLRRLPDSAFSKRMIARIEPLVELDEDKLGVLQTLSGKLRGENARKSAKFRVSLPEACDKAMQRDGIVAKPPQGMGERTWWLQQLLANVPLSYWRTRFDHSPKQIIAFADVEEWQKIFLIGWIEALQYDLQSDPHYPKERDWAEALLDGFMRIEGSFHYNRTIEFPWQNFWSQSELERRITAYVREHPRLLNEKHHCYPRMLYLISECKQTWGSELTLAFLNRIKSKWNDIWTNFYLLENTLPRLSVDGIVEMEEICNTSPDDNYAAQRLRPHLKKMLARKDMLENIRSDR